MDMNAEILQNNSKAIRRLETEVDNYSMDEKGLEAEVDFLINTKIKSATINEGFHRKRYIKKLQISFT